MSSVDTCAPPAVVTLDDPAAGRPDLVGAKAANLARARSAGLPALPGVVLTTAWSQHDRDAAVTAWRVVSRQGSLPVVVRSSSTGEDGEASSMAGVFESILDVDGEAELLLALDDVMRSADRARLAGLVDADMAILVQPMLQARGAACCSVPIRHRPPRPHRRRRRPRRPDQLVSGEVDGWTGVLDRRGRVREVRSPDAERPPAGDPAAPRPPRPPGRPHVRRPAGRRVGRRPRRRAAPAAGPPDHDAAADDGHGLRARPGRRVVPRRLVDARAGPVAGPAARRPARGALADRHGAGRRPAAQPARRRRRRHRRRRPRPARRRRTATRRAAPARSAPARPPPPRRLAGRPAAHRAARPRRRPRRPHRRRPRRRARRSTASATASCSPCCATASGRSSACTATRRSPAC